MVLSGPCKVRCNHLKPTQGVIEVCISEINPNSVGGRRRRKGFRQNYGSCLLQWSIRPQSSLMYTPICTKKSECPQYMHKPLHLSHHLLFKYYPLVSQEKGCSGLQAWLHCETHLVWGVTHNLRSLCWLTHHVLFMFIRWVRCLCLTSACDTHCSLPGITINFQQRSFKSPAICQTVSHHLAQNILMVREWWVVSPVNVQELCVLHGRWEFFPADTHVQPCWLSWKLHTYFWANNHHTTSRMLRDCARLLQQD